MLKELTVGDETFTLDNHPEQDRWLYSDKLQPFLDENLYNVVGYSNVYDYSTLEGIKFTHWYWNEEFNIRMLTQGLFYVSYVTTVKFSELKEQGLPLDIYLVLMDKDYIMEKLLRQLSPLSLDKDELIAFLTEEFILHYDSRQTILEEQKIKHWVQQSPIPVTYEQVKALLESQKKGAGLRASNSKDKAKSVI